VFNWLLEGQISVYILLLAVALVLLAIWWRARQRRLLIATSVVVLLIGVYWLLSLVPTEAKTDRAEIVRRLEEMPGAASRHDGAAIERNLSDQFRSPLGFDKKSIAQSVQSRGQDVKLKLSEIEFPTPPSRAEGTTKVNFHVEILEPINLHFHIESVFDWDAANGWRLRELHVFPPVGEELKRF
jgi:hypothetical protein